MTKHNHILFAVFAVIVSTAVSAGSDTQEVRDTETHSTLRKQIDALEKQKAAIEEQTRAMSGHSAKGALEAGDYAKDIPTNWRETLEAYKNNDTVKSLIQAMREVADPPSEELTDKERAKIETKAGTDRAMNGAALNAQIYQNATQRIKALDNLRLRIDEASTAKEIADLQARIQIENALLTNELIRTESLNALFMQNEYAQAYKSVDEDIDENAEDETGANDDL
ncbi:type IV secretion system VirB5/TraC/TraE/TrbJ family protein [Luteibacter rhizovicinus]|uniref:Type IV secretion system VirB5/TraC/TraE/TrbJ family protein n=1 Tax=Luteibacter rhizovicinus TaxID=242606 RepID=A0A4R3YSR6_9GAMM|nr:type IV secretion system protein [Luteibacter rhizovicinus]TCV94758.1 type IV secretion system VirB5/TraC/TraE/TrbJ family protein [Luteibacter rhizovicinus]